MEGTMIWFNPVKQHGFISTDEGERLRVDESGFAPGELLEERCRGTRVRFERSEGAKDEARAIDVRLVQAEVARRARPRGRR